MNIKFSLKKPFKIVIKIHDLFGMIIMLSVIYWAFNFPAKDIESARAMGIAGGFLSVLFIEKVSKILIKEKNEV